MPADLSKLKGEVTAKKTAPVSDSGDASSESKVKTGIPKAKEGLKGMDELLCGGIPRSNIVLVTGPAGAGKSILSLQFLVNGAEKFGESGMYINFEQNREDIVREALAFNWDLDKLESEGKLRILSFRVMSEHAVSISKEMKKEIEEFKPDRLVIDSLSSYVISMEAIGYLEIMMDYDPERKSNVKISPDMATRRSIMKLVESIKSAGTTAFMISERPEGSEHLSRDTISEFLSDGVLVLNFIGIGTEEFGTIQIRKMRHTKHARTTFQTFITNEGMKIGEESIGTMR